MVEKSRFVTFDELLFHLRDGSMAGTIDSVAWANKPHCSIVTNSKYMKIWTTLEELGCHDFNRKIKKEEWFMILFFKKAIFETPKLGTGQNLPGT